MLSSVRPRGREGEVTLVDFALVCQALFFGLTVWVFLRSGQASAFHPLTVYLAYHGLVFVLRPIFVHIYEYDFVYSYMRYYPDDFTVAFTLLVSSVGLAAFALASLRSGYARVAFRTFADPTPTREHYQAFALTAALCLPLALYSTWIMRNGHTWEGGDRPQLERADNGTVLMVDNTGYILDAQFMIPPIGILFIVLWKYRPWAFVPLVAYFGYRAVLGWSRWAIVLNLGIVCLIFLWRSRAKWPSWKTLLLAIPVWILFGTLGHNRDTLRLLLTPDVPGMSPFTEERLDTMNSLDFGGADFLAYIINVIPEKNGTYSYGSQHLQLLTEPIPRILWPGKPAGEPIRIVNFNDYGNYVGCSPSALGDGWTSGGMIGVVATLGFIGFLCGRMHRYFWRNQDRLIPVMLYCSFLPLTVQWFRDGGFVSMAKFLLFTWLPIGVFIGSHAIIARYNRRSDSR